MESKSKPMRVLSLGAGVQSSTIALMMTKGEIAPAECAIFADVKAEPRRVYQWLDWLEKQLSFPLYRVTRQNGLTRQIEDACAGITTRASTPPAVHERTNWRSGANPAPVYRRFQISPDPPEGARACRRSPGYSGDRHLAR